MTKERLSTPPDCNFCKMPLHHKFVDMLSAADNPLETVEKTQHIVHTYVCNYCFLVQVDSRSISELADHEYLTSYSPIWLNTMQGYTNSIFEKIEQTSTGLTVELINHKFCSERSCNVPVATLTKKDIYAFIEMYGKADRIICHNEMAYTRDINDFVAGIKLLLTPDGTFTIEFPHLLVSLENEKFTNFQSGALTYFSLTTIDIIFRKYKLVIYHTEDCLPEGCIRISGKHQENVSRHISRNTPALRGRERDKGMSSLTYYLNFKLKMERQMKSYEIL